MSMIPQRVQRAARSEYEIWRRNDGKEYWASRAISSQLSMSAKRTAVGVISKSECIIKELGSSLEQGLLNESEPDRGMDNKTSVYKAPSPTAVPTENINSPSMIQSGGTLPNPFQDGADEQEEDGSQSDTTEDDENNSEDFLLPDKIDRRFNFVGDLDGLDLASEFEAFFGEAKKKAVYIEDTDEVL
ncbi:hypothetical protein BGX26_007080, partial [Mortierella sp. AD094]